MSFVQDRRRGLYRHAAKRWARRRPLLLEALEPRVVLVSTLSVADATFNLSAGAAGFQVTRSGDLTPVVDVGYAITDGTAIGGTNYTSTAPTGVLQFASGQTSATIPLTILTNNFAETSRDFTVDLTGVVDTFGPPSTFSGQQTFATGTEPESVVVADVNDDGEPDLIIANQSDNTVSVLINTTAPGATTPSFAAQQTFATGINPVKVVAADLNGDGEPDLIVANLDGSTVSVLMNTTAPGATTASFAAQQTFATGGDPFSLATADLNGDGMPDLIVANQGDNTLSVLMNTTAPGATTASFAAQQTFATGGDPFSLATADLNGDGMPDLIVANQGDNTLSVLMNTTAPGATTASFAAQQTFATGNLPESVVAADLNGDGEPDLIVANHADDTLSVLLNTTAPGATTASFAAQQTFATGSDPESVVAADLNGDGEPDLVVANYDDDTVSVLLNTMAPGATTASFAAQQTFATGISPGSIVAADVNGDGRPDLIVANYGNNTVSVLLNTTSHVESTTAGVPAPLFTQAATPSVGEDPYSVTVADLNGDGKPDLIIANKLDNTLSVLMNTTAPGATTPTFAAQQTFAVGSEPDAVTAVDVNGDGLPDLIVSNKADDDVSVLLNTTPAGATTASFAAQQTFATGSNPDAVVTTDLNGDGEPDLIVANFNSNSVSVLLNTTAPGATTASFAAQQTFATGSNPDAVVTTDLNGDGEPDLIVANFDSNSVSVLLNTTAPGATTVSFAAQQTFATGSNPDAVVTTDLNGDGEPDLIVANFNSNSVSVLLNTTAPGATTVSFAAQQTFATGSNPNAVVASDVNGDGKSDLIVANFDSNSVSVLLNTTAPGATTASFAAQQTFATGSNPRSVVATDVNGDGLPAIIVANGDADTVSVLMNAPTVIDTNSATGTIASAPVESSFVLADDNPSSAATVDFTITFSEAVSGVTAANFALTGTGTDGASIGTPTTSDDGITWTVPVTVGGNGTLGLNLDDRTGITDSNGNQLYDSTSDDGSTFNPVVGPSYTIESLFPTSTSLSSSLSSSTYGQSVTFTATVTGTGTPTGTVTFYSGAINEADELGTGTLSVVDSQDVATYTTSTLNVDGSPYTITAVYGGDSDDQGSTSTSISQTINPDAFTYTIADDSQTYGTAADLATDLGTTINTGINGENLDIAYNSSGDTDTADAGSYGIMGTVSDGTGLASNYDVTLTCGTLTVNPYAFTFTIADDSQTYGTPADFATDLGTTINTGVNGENLDIAYNSSGDTDTADAGSYGIMGTVSDGTGLASNYNVTLTCGTLTVNPYAFTFTIADDSQTYGTPADFATDLGTTINTSVNGENLDIAYTSSGDTDTAGVGTYSIMGTISDGTGLASNYNVTLTCGTLTVNPHAFTFTIADDSQTYGTPADFATDLGTTIDTGVNDENLDIAYTSSGDTDTADAGSYGIMGTVSDGTGLASNYDVTLTCGTLTVNPYAFTYTIADDSQTYGTPADFATDLGTTINTSVNGENLDIAYTSSGDTDTAGVSTYSIMGTISDGTGLASNYNVTLTCGTLTVNPYAFTFTIADDSQTYGTAADLATDLGTTIDTGVNGENLDIAYNSSGDTDTADAGSYGIMGTVSDGTGLASNYNVTLTCGTLTVNPYAFTFTIADDSQTYGTPADFATDLGTTIDTGVNDENLDIAYTSSGDTDTADAGSYGIMGTVSDGTGLASNYDVTLTCGTLTVNPYAFTYTIADDSQTYGTPADFATDLGTTIDTGVNGENLDIAYTSSGDTDTAGVGTYSIMGTISDGTGLASNYNVTLTCGTLTVNPYAFTFTIADDSQTYGTAADLATDLGTTIDTGVNGENLDIAYTSSGDTDTADAGSYGIMGTVSDGTGLASNYDVTLTCGTLTVSPYAFTFTIANDSQTYGTAANFATDLGTTINTGINGENLDIAYTSSGDTDTADAGSYGIMGTVSDGTGLASNYDVTLTCGTLTVNPYAFTFTIADDSQTYGTPADFATDLGTTIDTGVNDENLDIAYTSSGDTDTAGVGTYSIMGTISDGTGLASNYNVTLTCGTLTVNPYAFTFTIADDSQTYGTAADLATDLGTTIDTGVNGENLDIAYTSSGDTDTADAGSYGIMGTVSDGTGLASNYDVTLTCGTLTVNPYAFTFTIADDSQTYGTAATLAADLPGTIATGVNSETLDIAYSSTGDTGTASAGSYDIDGSLSNGTGLTTDYDVTLTPGTLTVMQAPLTITANNQTMIFGTPLPTLTASYSGFVNGETAASLTTLPTLSTTATMNSPVSGNPYPITASGAVDPNYAISYVAGSLTVLTSTITLSPSSLDLGTTTAGTAGAVASYTVSGSNLTADLLISAPSGVEVSEDGGTTWSSSLDLAESGSTVAPTTIEVQIAASASAGSLSGDIANTSPGATTQEVAVSGTIQASSQAGTVVSSMPQTFYGQSVTLTATFQSTADGSAPMTGTVTFYDGSTDLGTADLVPSGSTSAASANLPQGAPSDMVSGSADLTTSELGVGDHTIKAVYSGDSHYATATSETPVSVQVTPAQTSTALTSSTTAQATTLIATIVVTSPGNPPLTGTVAFYDGNTLLGTAPVSNGVATLDAGILSSGNHAFSAVFSGGGTASTSQSSLAVSTDGPQVMRVLRYGYHAQPTYLLLHFNGPLDPTSAENPANYRIVGPAGNRITIVAAIFDSATDTVTLVPAERLNIHERYRLTVNGDTPSGLTSPSGESLDATEYGQAGSNFVTSITGKNLAGRYNQLPTLGLVHGAHPRTTETRAATHHATVKLHTAAVDHLLAKGSLLKETHRPRR